MKPVAAAISLALAISAAPVFAGTTYTTTVSTASMPSKCPDTKNGLTGVCVLISVSPAATGFFTVVDSRGNEEDVYGNSVRTLQPGNYTLYEADAMADGYGVPFTVAAGKVTNIKTGTIVNNTSVNMEIQTTPDILIPSTVGYDCSDQSIDSYARGAYAFLPNTYYLDQEVNEGACGQTELQVKLEAGKVVNFKKAK